MLTNYQDAMMTIKHEPPQKELEQFICRAGFTGGWENLESWARRMAKQAVSERKELQAIIDDGKRQWDQIAGLLGVSGDDADAVLKAAYKHSQRADFTDDITMQLWNLISVDVEMENFGPDELRAALQVVRPPAASMPTGWSAVRWVSDPLNFLLKAPSGLKCNVEYDDTSEFAVFLRELAWALLATTHVAAVRVPDAMPTPDHESPYVSGYVEGWNACREAVRADQGVDQ